MLLTDKLSSAIVRMTLVFMLGLAIGGVKGCGYGEKRAYKTILQEKQVNTLSQRENPYVLMYEKENNKIYAVPLNDINTFIETENSNLEKIVKKF